MIPEFFLLSMGISYLIGKEIKSIWECFRFKKTIENKDGKQSWDGLVLLEGKLEADSYLFSSFSKQRVLYCSLIKENLFPINDQNAEPFYQGLNYAQNLSIFIKDRK